MIRLVRKSDIHILAKLDQESNLTFWHYEDYLLSFNNPRHKLYVLENGKNEIIATIVLSIILDDAEILQFWVKQNYKRCGYGKTLLKHILDKLKLSKILQVFLEVRCGNTSAINLYKSFGFQIVGKRYNYYAIDNWHCDAITMLYTNRALNLE